MPRSLGLIPGAVVVAIALVGCSGAVGTTREENNVDNEGGNAGTSVDDPGEGGTTSAEPQPVGPCEGKPRPGPSPLRRLTPWEYTNTVRDLFRVTNLPSVTLAQDQVVKTFGFDNNAVVQTPASLLVSQYQQAALALTEAAFKTPAQFMPCMPKAAAEEQVCGQKLVAEFGARAFRRPLTSAEIKDFGEFFEAQRTAANFNVAAQLTVQAMLQSPGFLYRVEFGSAKQADGSLMLAPYELAARLSYLIWASMPDDKLFEAAKSNKLSTADEVEAQARRLLADDRAHGLVEELHAQWFGFRALDTVEKDKGAYPTWSPELRAGLRAEASAAVTAAVFGDGANYMNLFTSSKAYVNKPLAALYGVTAPAAGSGWVDLNTQERSGFVTQAWWLATYAHQILPAPVLRGTFVMSKLFCSPPSSPPAGVNTSVPTESTAVAKTNRQRLTALHATQPSCKACHKPIEGIGFGLEGYDAMGAFRTTDNGEPVDDSGEIAMDADVDGSFKGGVALAKKLADSKDVKSCVVTQWFRFAMGRPEQNDDACTLEALRDTFQSTKYNAPELLVAIARSPAFRTRLAVVPAQ